MDELMDAQAAVSLCNVLLAYSGITIPVTCVQEVQALGASVSLFVAATEVLLRRRLDRLHRHPSNTVRRAANCASVLAALSATRPGLGLSHILPSAVVAGDMVHILSLLETLAELSRMPGVLEQPATEASQTAAAGSRPAQDCRHKAGSSNTAPVAKELALELKAAPEGGSPAKRNKSVSDMPIGMRSPARKAAANSAGVPAMTSSSRCSRKRSPTKQRKRKTNRTGAAAVQGSARWPAPDTSAATGADVRAAVAAAAVGCGVQVNLCLSTCQQSLRRTAFDRPAVKTVLQTAADSMYDTEAAKTVRGAAADRTCSTAGPRVLSRAVFAALAVAGDVDAAQASKLTEQQLDNNICYAGQQQLQQHGHCNIANAGQKAAAAAPAAADGDGDVAVDTHRALQQLQLALSGAAALLQQHIQSADTPPLAAAAHMDCGNSLEESYINRQADHADVANVACVAADREQERQRYVEKWVIGAADAGSPQQQQQQQQSLHRDAAPKATRLLSELLEEQIQVQVQLDSLLTQQQAAQQTEQQQQYTGVAAPVAVQEAVQHGAVHAAAHQTVQQAVQGNSTQSAHGAVQPAVQLPVLQSHTNAAQHSPQLPAECCLQQPVIRGLDAAAAAAGCVSDNGAAVTHQASEDIQVGRCSRLAHLHHTTLKLLEEVQQQQQKLLLQQQDAMQLCKQAEAAATAASQCEAGAAATMQQGDVVPCRAEALTAGQQLPLNQKSVLEASSQQINLLMAGLQTTEQHLLLQQQQILASMPMAAVQLSQGHHHQQKQQHQQQQLFAPVLMEAEQMSQADQQRQPITNGPQSVALEHVLTAQHPEQVQRPMICAVHQQQRHEQQQPLGISHLDIYKGQSSKREQLVHSNGNRDSRHNSNGNSNNRKAMRPSSGNSVAHHENKRQQQQQQQLMRQVMAVPTASRTSTSVVHKYHKQPDRRPSKNSSSSSRLVHSKAALNKLMQQNHMLDVASTVVAVIPCKTGIDRAASCGVAPNVPACQRSCSSSSSSSMGSWAGDCGLVSDGMVAASAHTITNDCSACTCTTQQQMQAAAVAAKVAAAAAEQELASQRAWQQPLLKQHAAEARRLLQKQQQQAELQDKQRDRDVKISQLQEQLVTDQVCRDAERQQRRAAAQAAAEAAEAAPAIENCTHYRFKAAAAAVSPIGSGKASVGRPGVPPAASKAATRLRASCCSAARGVTDTVAASPQHNRNADAVPLHELQQLRQDYQQLLGVFEGLLVSERRGRMEAERLLAQLVRQHRTESRQQQQDSEGGSPVRSPARWGTHQGGWMA